jgi:adenine-specific DNA-methyltransferase
MIKYIGSKRRLVPLLGAIIDTMRPQGHVLDAFSGTARVGHALKQRGHRVTSNDHNAYAATLARCYVEADKETWDRAATQLVDELNRLPGAPDYFTATFCEKSRFFHPKNGARVDAIRERLARMGLEPALEAVMLTSLMEAADRVDSTVGVQMAYLKDWAPRAHNDLELRVPELLPRVAAGGGRAMQLDVLDAVRDTPADIIYLDPPYNQHKYRSNYHIWETLVVWDKPEVYGVACKRTDCRTQQSPFNSKARAESGLQEVLHESRASDVVLSFNDEGFVAPTAIESMLRAWPHVLCVSVPFQRYVGAQIGVYDPSGVRVGVPGRRHNTEHVYIATSREETAQALAALGDWHVRLCPHP